MKLTLLDVDCMNIGRSKTTMKLIVIIVVAFSIIMLSACSSPEEKAKKFYDNGMSLFEKGDYAKANIEFRNALQIDPNMSEAIWGQILVAEKKNKPKRLFKLLNTYLERKPENIEALTKQSRLLLLAGQLDKSLEFNNRSFDINPNNQDVLSLRAAIFYKLNDRESALKYANKVIESSPTNIDALIVLATDSIASGEYIKAIDYLDKGLSNNANNVALQFLKIQALEKLSRM